VPTPPRKEHSETRSRATPPPHKEEPADSEPPPSPVISSLRRVIVPTLIGAALISALVSVRSARRNASDDEAIHGDSNTSIYERRSRTGPSHLERSYTGSLTSDSSQVRSQDSLETWTYRARKGDTLYYIARMNGVSVQTLLTLNGLQRDSFVHPGDSILIPGPKPFRLSTPLDSTWPR
jgi:hypothetical protein